MSDQEQDEIILKVVKDARAAHQEVMLWREKAHTVCEDMEAVLGFLRKLAGFRDAGRGDRPREDLTTSFERLPNGADIRDLSHKLKAAIERESDLSERKQQLGI